MMVTQFEKSEVAAKAFNGLPTAATRDSMSLVSIFITRGVVDAIKLQGHSRDFPFDG